MSICTICVEKFHGTNRKKVRCPSCDFAACMVCVQTYLLSITEDAQCMSCKQTWAVDYVHSVLTKTFRTGDYKRHRERILYERERGMLPATQAILERTLEADQAIQALTTECTRLKTLIATSKQELLQSNLDLERLKELRRTIMNGDATAQIKDAKLGFIKPCPGADCNGFLNTTWKCGLCHIKVCSECFGTINNQQEKDEDPDAESKDAEHICDEEDLKTAAEIKATCKNCPKCGAMTYKIDGCSQMFCTYCGTAWNWDRGTIVHGRIHNPHYYDYIRQRNNGVIPREPGDVRCGGLVPLREILQKQVPETAPDRSLTVRTIIEQYHHIIAYIQRQQQPRYRVAAQLDYNFDLRMQFLKKEITEDRFKILLQRREKCREKNVQIYQLLQMFVDTASDLFRDLHGHAITYYEFVHQMEQLRDYYAHHMAIICKRFDCNVKTVNEYWVIPRHA